MQAWIIRLAAIMTAATLAGGMAWANNVMVTNTTLTAPAAGKVAVQFDLTWNNSWRNGVNYDACWVFVKYSIDAGATWSHATLAASGTNPPGFTNGVGANLDIVVPADKKGAFIQRSVEGTGTVANTGLKLWWDFATNGVSRSRSARVRVFTVEMVYVPAGAFWAGNTNGVINSSFRVTGVDNTNSPVYIDSTNAFDIYYGTGAGTKAAISNTFPNGYGAFYLMKTEISQRQYCDFLNTLTPIQQDNRHDAGLHFNISRNFIKKTGGSPAVFGCDANGNAGAVATNADFAYMNETNDGEWVACNHLSWADGAAYADWAALRPFTELEFEKACRGADRPAVDSEYAWGDAGMEALTSAMNNENTAMESPNQGNCNYVGCWRSGPYRCGSYADASSSRANAGAGYYGALDLSGNLWERPVTVGNGSGLAFTGEHGNGELKPDGDADVSNWPEADATGTGWRGGGWQFASDYARASDRFYAANVAASRINTFGWRGARSASSGVGP